MDARNLQEAGENPSEAERKAQQVHGKLSIRNKMDMSSSMSESSRFEIKEAQHLTRESPTSPHAIAVEEMEDNVLVSRKSKHTDERLTRESPLSYQTQETLMESSLSISYREQHAQSSESSINKSPRAPANKTHKYPSKASSRRHHRHVHREKSQELLSGDEAQILDTAHRFGGNEPNTNSSALRHSSGGYRRSGAGVIRRRSKASDATNHTLRKSSDHLSPPTSPTTSTASAMRHRRKSKASMNIDGGQEEGASSGSKPRRRRTRSSSRDMSSSHGQGRHRSKSRDRNASPARQKSQDNTMASPDRRRRSSSKDLFTRRYRSSSRDMSRRLSPKRTRSASRDRATSPRRHRSFAGRKKTSQASAPQQQNASNHSQSHRSLRSGTGQERNRVRSKAALSKSGKSTAGSSASRRRHRSLSTDAAGRRNLRRSHSQDAERTASNNSSSRSLLARSPTSRHSNLHRKSQTTSNSTHSRSITLDNFHSDSQSVPDRPPLDGKTGDDFESDIDDDFSIELEIELSSNGDINEPHMSMSSTGLGLDNGEDNEVVLEKNFGPIDDRLGNSSTSLQSSSRDRNNGSPKPRMRGRRPKQELKPDDSQDDTVSLSAVATKSLPMSPQGDTVSGPTKGSPVNEGEGCDPKHSTALPSLEDFLAAPPQPQALSTLPEPSVCSLSLSNAGASEEKTSDVDAIEQEVKSTSGTVPGKHFKSFINVATPPAPTINSSSIADGDSKLAGERNGVPENPAASNPKLTGTTIEPDDSNRNPEIVECLFSKREQHGESADVGDFVETGSFATFKSNKAHELEQVGTDFDVRVVRHTSSVRTRSTFVDGQLAEEESGEEEYLQLRLPDSVPMPPPMPELDDMKPLSESALSIEGSNSLAESPVPGSTPNNRPGLFQRFSSRVATTSRSAQQRKGVSSSK